MSMNNRFFSIKSGVSAKDLAELLECPIIGHADLQIMDIGSVTDCKAGSLCFVADKSAADVVSKLNGIVHITTPELAPLFNSTTAVIVSATPRRSFAKAASWLVDYDDSNPLDISERAQQSIDESALVSPRATIGRGVVIGAGSRVEAGAVVHDNVVIGAGCRIGANASISFSVIGDDVVIQAGCVIGETGFGFEMTPDGPEMMPHLGGVEIGAGSHIGANSTIARGSLGDTVIGRFVMIDNLVQVAHNCVIGDRSVITSQVGIAGSTVVGHSVVIGGQVGIADHVTIGDGAVLMARSGITKNVDSGAKIAGFPGEDAGKYWRDQAKLRSLLRGPKTKK